MTKTLSGPILPRFLVVIVLVFLPTVHADTFVGLTYPIHDVTVSSGTGGLVSKLAVLPGQSVRTDQLLLQFDDRLQAIDEHRRQTIYEDLSEIKATKDRTRILELMWADAKAVFNETASISRDELLRLESDYSASVGRLEQLEAQKAREKLDLEYATTERLLRLIKAPVDGIVTKVFFEPGEWAKPGEPIIIIVDFSKIVFRVAVPHRIVHLLKVGANQTVHTESGTQTAQSVGRVSFVSPVADPASGLVQVEVKIDNAQRKIRPGVKGTIEISPDLNVR